MERSAAAVHKLTQLAAAPPSPANAFAACYAARPPQPGPVLTGADFEIMQLNAALRDLDEFALRYPSMTDVLDVIGAARKLVSERVARAQRSKLKAVELD